MISFSGGLGSPGVMVGTDVHKGLFQLSLYYDSVILRLQPQWLADI